MAKRIFVAIKISEGLGQIIKKWQDSQQNFQGRWIAPKNLHITLVPPWHTTEIDSTIEQLRAVVDAKSSTANGAAVGPMPGAVDGAASDTALSPAPFEIKFNAIRGGPDARAPRLLWLEGPTPPALLELKHRIEQTLKRHVTNGGRPEFHMRMNQKNQIEKTPGSKIISGRLSPQNRGANNQFHLHITLARFKRGAAFSNRDRPNDIPSSNHDRPNGIPTAMQETVDWRESVNSFALMESHLLADGADYEILETFPLISSAKP